MISGYILIIVLRQQQFHLMQDQQSTGNILGVYMGQIFVGVKDPVFQLGTRRIFD